MKRFWNKVKKKAECWEWCGAKDRNGYGHIRIDGHLLSAHRLSWVLAYGDIPKGLQVLHKCDNRPCVRPAHLFLGTQRDNIVDMKKKGRSKTCGYATVNNKGSKNHFALLHEAHIRAIRLRYKSGETQEALAKFFATTQANISLIVNNVSWRHVK